MTNPLEIGPLKLGSNVLLAPMSGYGDLAFRLVARSCGGVGLAYTDLLCPEGVLRESRKSMELARTGPEDAPLAMQLYGSDPQSLADAARWAENHGAAVVDINMGCPADKITRRASGSSLLRRPADAVRVVQRVKAALRRVPLTAKLRLGWDDSSIVAPALARCLEDAGVAMVVVHGRTAAMRFSGRVRLDAIGEVVTAVKHIPVIGNGDIRTPPDARRMIDTTGCHGVMIGRAALCAPWLLRDIWSYLQAGTTPPPPSLEEKCRLMREHFRGIMRYRSERAAVLEFRHRISWYAAHLHPCNELRQEMRFIRSADDFEAALERFLQRRIRKTAGLTSEV